MQRAKNDERRAHQPRMTSWRELGRRVTRRHCPVRTASKIDLASSWMSRQSPCGWGSDVMDEKLVCLG